MSCIEARQFPTRLPSLLRTALLAVMVGTGAVSADVVPETMNGVPLLPIPTFEEVGLPAFTVRTGTPSMPSTPPGNGSSAGGSAGGTGSSSGPALDAMLSRSWGYAAQSNSESLGVNAAAVAATCMIESNCQNVNGSGTISGAFQMRDDTYLAMINSARQRDPNLASSIMPGLAGKMDPATQSIAAAEYLRQGAAYLQARDISNPTVLDVRGYYNFGPGNAVAIARARDSDLMSSQVTGLTPAQFRANGINPETTTVGQWRATVINKVGQSTAQAPVLLTRT